jgi:uncharacterized protein
MTAVIGLRHLCAVLLLAWLCAACVSVPAPAPAPVAPAPAQQQATPAPAASGAATVDAAVPRGPLFSFSKSGRTHTLMGTLHIGKNAWYPMDWGVIAPLSNADVLMLEADINDTAELQLAMSKYGLDDAQGSAWAGLPAPLRERLAAVLDKQPGAPDVMQNFKRMRPWLAASALSTAAASELGLQSANGTEIFLRGVATALKMPVVSLEGFVVQLALFNAMPPPVRDDFVKQALDALESGTVRSQLEQLASAWEAGDLAALQTQIDPQRMKSPSEKFFLEVLLRERDAVMAEKIDAAAQSQTLFVAVGSLHLAGPGGLVDLLQTRGYTVLPALRGVAARKLLKNASKVQTAPQ